MKVNIGQQLFKLRRVKYVVICVDLKCSDFSYLVAPDEKS